MESSGRPEAKRFRLDREDGLFWVMRKDLSPLKKFRGRELFLSTDGTFFKDSWNVF